MKQRILLTAIMLLSVFYLFSQEHSLPPQGHSLPPQDRGSLALSFGPAFPVGEFANNNGNDPLSGLAKVGGLADLTYMRPFSRPDFGYTVSLRARMNSINSSALRQPFADQYQGYNWDVSAKPWEAAAAMIGLFHRYSAKKNRLFLEEAVLLGVAETLLPEETITGISESIPNASGPDYIQAMNNKIHSTTFTFMTRIGGGIQLSDKLSLVAHLDYWWLDPVFRNLTQTVTTASGFTQPFNLNLSNAVSTSRSEYTSNYTQNMSSVNLSIGLALQL
jgi:hypothetical protein